MSFPTSNVRQRPEKAILVPEIKPCHLRNAAAPLYRLPTEMVLNIIEAVLMPPRDFRNALTRMTSPVLRFCHRFREVALAFGYLWGYIRTDSKRVAEEVLRRSRDCLLDVVWPTMEVLAVLIDHVPRWKTLGLDADPTSAGDIGYRTVVTVPNAPNLTTATLISRGIIDNPLGTLAWKAPKLRNLRSDFLPYPKDPLWQRLVIFDLQDAEIDTSVFATVLEKCNLLQCLSITNCNSHSSKVNDAPSYPPKLRHVKLHGRHYHRNEAILKLIINLISGSPQRPQFDIDTYIYLDAGSPHPISYVMPPRLLSTCAEFIVDPPPLYSTIWTSHAYWKDNSVLSISAWWPLDNRPDWNFDEMMIDPAFSIPQQPPPIQFQNVSVLTVHSLSKLMLKSLLPLVPTVQELTLIGDGTDMRPALSTLGTHSYHLLPNLRVLCVRDHQRQNVALLNHILVFLENREAKSYRNLERIYVFARLEPEWWWNTKERLYISLLKTLADQVVVN